MWMYPVIYYGMAQGEGGCLHGVCRAEHCQELEIHYPLKFAIILYTCQNNPLKTGGSDHS